MPKNINFSVTLSLKIIRGHYDQNKEVIKQVPDRLMMYSDYYRPYRTYQFREIFQNIKKKKFVDQNIKKNFFFHFLKDFSSLYIIRRSGTCFITSLF